MVLQARSALPRLSLPAWLLALAGFILFASLYPFRGWKDLSLLVPGILDFFSAGLPRYWTGFDVIANVVIYLPLGLLLQWLLRVALPRGRAAVFSLLCCSGLSLLIEWLQILLPGRVPSMLDWMLNTLGALLGVLVGALTDRERLEDWLRDLPLLSPTPAEGLRPLNVLLLLWLLAQLTPRSLAFSVGDMPGGLPWLDASMGLVYAPLLEALGTALSVLVIGLMIQALPGVQGNVIAPALSVFVLAILAKSAVAAVLLGPSLALGWFSAATQGGLLIGLSALSVLSMITRSGSRRQWALLVVGLLLMLLAFNLVPESEYHRTFMQAWNPRHLRAVEAFLAVLGLLWPWLALVYCTHRLLAARPIRWR